jgi:hypothetical protein
MPLPVISPDRISSNDDYERCRGLCTRGYAQPCEHRALIGRNTEAKSKVLVK